MKHTFLLDSGETWLQLIVWAAALRQSFETSVYVADLNSTDTWSRTCFSIKQMSYVLQKNKFRNQVFIRYTLGDLEGNFLFKSFLCWNYKGVLSLDFVLRFDFWDLLNL